ncbi:MAG: PEP-CTERM sorting domain-containing protein [Aquabacterium sp.]
MRSFALALAVLPLFAQADTAIATHTAQLSNLRIELIDLDPSDGITPAFSYDADLIGLSGEAVIPTVPKDPAALLPSKTFEYTDGSLHLSVGPDSVSAGTTWTLAQAVTGREWQEGSVFNSDTVNFERRMQAVTFKTGTTSLLDFELPRFTLTPNTRIVISGQASYSRELGTAALNEWLATSGYDHYTLQENAPFIGVIAQFRRDGEVPGEWVEGDPESFFMSSQDETPLTVSDTSPGGIAAVGSNDFSIAFSNATGTATSGVLLMSAVADPMLTLALTRSATPTPVPEPGSWALMGLGLAFGAVAMRKQRHTSQR